MPGPPSQRYRTVTLLGGRSGHLDMADPRSGVWIEVLRSLQESGQPVYLEIDPSNDLITELLLPIRYAVGRIEPVPDDGLDVELIVSHARHYLRRSNPDFEELHEALKSGFEQRMFVLVTETLDDHEIIDVRSRGEPVETKE